MPKFCAILWTPCRIDLRVRSSPLLWWFPLVLASWVPGRCSEVLPWIAKTRAPEDRVIVRRPVHDFEIELLSSVVMAIAEAKFECYSTLWVVGASWYDSMERAVCLFQELQWYVHCSKCFCIDQVYSTSCIHDYPFYVVPSNLSFEYQRRVSWPRYCYGVIFSVEFYGLLGLVQMFCSHWRRCYC
jgi:hypothetical protein